MNRRINASLSRTCLLLVPILVASGCGRENPAFLDDLPGDDLAGSSGGKPLSLQVVNRLFSPVEIKVAGTSFTTVSRLDSSVLSIRVPPGQPVEWVMIPVQSVSGENLGETLSGRFDIPSVARGGGRHEITNVVAGEKYFALLIGNTTSAELTLGVNMGLPEPESRWEKSDYFPLRPHSPLTYTGYYRLLESSNIRVYHSGSNYAGPYDTWVRFSHRVDDLSGIVVVNVYAVPSG